MPIIILLLIIIMVIPLDYIDDFVGTSYDLHE